MFQSLDEQMKRAQGRMATIWNRVLQYAAVFLLTVALFGGLNWGIRFLE